MEMTTTADAGEHSITVPTSPADTAGGAASGEVLLGVRVTSEEQQQMERSANRVKRKLKGLNKIVFCIAFLEWAGNAAGTLALLWATVILLGGFSSLLTDTDFWLITVMIFMEATRVFIRNDASLNQWLFGSTRAFRWDDFSFPQMHKHGNLIAVIIGVGIFHTPMEFQPEIVAGILKVALMAITSQLLTRRHWSLSVKVVLALLLVAAFCGGGYGFWKLAPHRKPTMNAQKMDNFVFLFAYMFTFYIFIGVMGLLANGASKIMSGIQSMRKPALVLCLKVIIASVLTCVPFLQAKQRSKYRFFSIPMATGLLELNPESWRERGNSSPETLEQNTNTLLLEISKLILKIVDTFLPILFFWSVLFPLPGISLKVSFYMLFSVIAAVLVGNIQIPVAFLHVLLSILCLCRLLGHHHHDYQPLPDGASPNLVPSIVVFYMLELFHGSSYILGIILGIISFQHRRSLVHALKFTKEWGSKAINQYYHQAYQVKDRER